MFTLFSFVLGLCYCGERKYPATSQFFEKVISIVKENKGNLEEAKKKTKELVAKSDNKKLLEEMDHYRKKLKSFFNPGSLSNEEEMEKAKNKAQKFADKELPQLVILEELEKKPEYSKVINGIMPIIQTLESGGANKSAEASQPVDEKKHAGLSQTVKAPKVDSAKKYPVLTKLLSTVITIVKNNKENPEEAKKQVQAFISTIDKSALDKDHFAFGEAMNKKMKEIKDSGEKNSNNTSGLVMEGIKEELPQMGEILKMGENPDYRETMKAIGTVMESFMSKK